MINIKAPKDKKDVDLKVKHGNVNSDTDLKVNADVDLKVNSERTKLLNTTVCFS